MFSLATIPDAKKAFEASKAINDNPAVKANLGAVALTGRRSENC